MRTTHGLLAAIVLQIALVALQPALLVAALDAHLHHGGHHAARVSLDDASSHAGHVPCALCSQPCSSPCALTVERGLADCSTLVDGPDPAPEVVSSSIARTARSRAPPPPIA